MQFRRAGDGDDPGLLREQPGEGDLRRCGLFRFGDLPQQIDQRLVRLARFGREARHGVAEVAAVELVFSSILPVRNPLPERTERNETDAEFFERRQDFRLGLPPPQRVFALQGRHRLHGMRTTDGLHAGFGEAEVPYLACGISSFTVPATSSIGTSGSTRC